jgi:hypothetical protein
MGEIQRIIKEWAPEDALQRDRIIMVRRQYRTQAYAGGLRVVKQDESMSIRYDHVNLDRDQSQLHDRIENTCACRAGRSGLSYTG